MKINAIQIPEGAGPELEKRFAARAGVVEGAAGFLGFQLLRPVKGEDRYFVVTQWEDDASYEAWAGGDARAAHKSDRKPVASGANLLEFEVVLDVAPKA
ncbi:antibiotic biosynthesis monooxygenase [Gordonia neofelifaecis NRRL B-59395]|uniref:Antibiotic biosynthesis monooxygenase n=1 Tax=Gordonia neofelifaecis NRRL B-59395 TaxID=644548 RepID=F1YIW2_9ACTN|nr:antibiotic biosynthesis monooxygenase [Gordonia neofelifaecis NRRL B-59395]